MAVYDAVVTGAGPAGRPAARRACRASASRTPVSRPTRARIDLAVLHPLDLDAEDEEPTGTDDRTGRFAFLTRR